LTITPSGGDVAIDGSISGNAPIVTTTSLTAAQMAGGLINNSVQNAFTASVASVAGMNFILAITTDPTTNYVSFDPYGSEVINLNGVDAAAGELVKSTDTNLIGSHLACYCPVAGRWICKSSGTWQEDTP